MVLLYNAGYVFPTVAAAQAVADANNAGDLDGWTYQVVVDPVGGVKAIVEVYDDEGFKLGPL